MQGTFLTCVFCDSDNCGFLLLEESSMMHAWTYLYGFEVVTFALQVAKRHLAAWYLL
jgi:hypothetical protein